MNKHLQHFETRYGIGETVKAWVPCSLEQDDLHRGVLIVTDKRVVFCRRGFFGMSEIVRSVGLERVTGVDRSTGMKGRTVVVHAGAQSIAVRTVWKAKAEEDAVCAAIEGRS